MHRFAFRWAACAAALAVPVALPAHAQEGGTESTVRYMMPPAEVARILEAPSPPLAFPNPTGTTVALMRRPDLPPIAELSQPDLGLAGQRITPRNHGPAGTISFESLSFQPTRGGAPLAVDLPGDARLGAPLWSPDGRHLAFQRLLDETVELWVANASTGEARRLTDGVNAGFAGPAAWLPDGSGLVVRLVPRDRGEPPAPSRVPRGPVVQENRGRAAPTRTLQNLLSSPHDEALFAHYLTSRLHVVPLDGSAPRPIGEPGIILDHDVSPDGRHLLTTRLMPPFSYSVAASSFPARIEIVDLSGRVLRRIADLPARDAIGTRAGSVAPGPRSIRWRADAPATLVWAEAQDNGDVGRPAEIRDRIYLLSAPFEGPPRVLIDLQGRYVETLWGRDDFALVRSRPVGERGALLHAVAPARPGEGRLFHRSETGEPPFGRPLFRADAAGRDRLHFAPDGHSFFAAHGRSVLKVDLQTGTSASHWRTPDGASFQGLLGEAGDTMLVSRESQTEPRNLFVARRSGGPELRLTRFTDPAPEFAQVQRMPVSYRRADGVPLRGTLYLPPGYERERDGPLPTIFWAYPTEVASADALIARADRPARTRFVRPGTMSPLPLVMRGYAVFDGPGMPIVGAEGRVPNDAFVEQLVMNAEAAVAAVVDLGVADPDRLAIGGWSYGASMAASLLAHTDLFRAGISLSGAYNRTLTPFGFQTERRTYWEATDAYMQIAPFTHADRINEPLLLIHGDADANSGTHLMQSERFYDALKGNGATARLVILPFEGHQYRARESVMHAMWEMARWLDAHLAPQPAPAED